MYVFVFVQEIKTKNLKFCRIIISLSSFSSKLKEDGWLNGCQNKLKPLAAAAPSMWHGPCLTDLIFGDWSDPRSFNGYWAIEGCAEGQWRWFMKLAVMTAYTSNIPSSQATQPPTGCARCRKAAELPSQKSVSPRMSLSLPPASPWSRAWTRMARASGRSLSRRTSVREPTQKAVFGGQLGGSWRVPQP